MSPVRANRPINQPPVQSCYLSINPAVYQHCKIAFAVQKTYIRSANLVSETPYTPTVLFLTEDGILGLLGLNNEPS
jgi:hypothetical protein